MAVLMPHFDILNDIVFDIVYNIRLRMQPSHIILLGIKFSSRFSRTRPGKSGPPFRRGTKERYGHGKQSKPHS